MYLDVYRGKNYSNVGVVGSHKSLPTTQKVVCNAMVNSGIDNDPNGYRIIWMDNRYDCPELCAYLWERYNILSAGTCRKNRIGWDKDFFI